MPTKSKSKIKPKLKTKKDIGKVHYPKIVIIGIGGGGGSIVSEIAKSIRARKIPHLDKIKFIVANVDFQAIKNAPKQTSTFYFGKEFTHGLGCGMRAEIGEKAALASRNGIQKILRNNDICIFISSLGGGTGSGASPVFASVAKDLGISSMGIFTKPFSFEGKERSNIAINSLRALKPKLNAITIIPNQKIFQIVDKNTPINKSLSAMNNLLVDILEGLIETLYLPGLINLDFSDFQAMLDTEKSLTYLHSQISTGSNRAEKSIESVLNNPLINYNIQESDRILFNITGSKDLRMSEVSFICERVASFNPMARIIFGVGQDNRYKNKLKITLMAVGCEKKEGKKIIKKKAKKKSEIKDQGIQLEMESEDIVLDKAKALEPTKENEKAVDIKKEDVKIEKNENGKRKKIPLKKRIVKKVNDNMQKEKSKKVEKKKKTKIEILVEEQPEKNDTIRRNALDLHREAEKDIQRMYEEESKWDVPTFLRGNKNNN
ncbi:cell division FtsZ family protein [Patescibacteria group bacterium]|nr:cell division FtsZ family protein [Patescibacteria group bacterium]MBU4023291.1 cell division FtsZ family protein [Patescibacteria group bacterium]MBU4078131.1 cell division FtsZ family protein [Patescibacteria group bacterium]